MQRIGVFVCHCGSNIAATVDVKKVVETVLHEPGVAHAEDYQYMCSEAGQAKIAAALDDNDIPDKTAWEAFFGFMTYFQFLGDDLLAFTLSSRNDQL